jgi:GNAT superfamily N-acetyltransferase
VYWAPFEPAGHRRIRMYDQEGYEIGTLVWKVCNACRLGSPNKISISEEWQRKGLGRRLVARALRDGPGFTWQTTGQSRRPNSSSR